LIASWFLTWWQPITWPAILLGSEAWRARSFEHSAEPEQQAAISISAGRRPNRPSPSAGSARSDAGSASGVFGDGQRPCRLRPLRVGSVPVQSPRADQIGFRAGLPLDGIIRIARRRRSLLGEVQDGFVPLTRQIEGFKSYYLLDGGQDVL
jgi:hypothetical protein